VKRDKLILGCGIGRCGTGWLSFFMFLNPEIAVWDGPGMGQLFQHTAGKTGLPPRDLHTVWGNDFQAPTHASKNGMGEWDGFHDFMPYYGKRIRQRTNSSAYFISHVQGEQWFDAYVDHFDCDMICVYCGREIISHYRSFKRWYYADGFAPGEFVERLRGSMHHMQKIMERDIPVVAINVPDYTVKKCAAKAAAMMKRIGIDLSPEQKLFLKKRRKLGPAPTPPKETNAELLSELQTVPDFEDVKASYDAFRRKHEA